MNQILDQLFQNIEITPTHSDNLCIYEHSDPSDLAMRFSIKHNLTQRAYQILVQNIANTQKAALNKDKPQQFKNPAPSSFSQLLDTSTRSSSLKPQIQQLIQDNQKLRQTVTRQSVNPNQTFQPKINRSSSRMISAKRESVHSSAVFERLYGYAAVKQSFQKQLRERTEASNQKQSVSPIKNDGKVYQPFKDHREPLKQSNLMQKNDQQVYDIWRTQLIKLFKMIDGNKDGVITRENIDFKQLNPQLKALMGYILFNMVSNQKYNFDEFFEMVTLRCVDQDLTESLMEAMGNKVK